ncbi:Argonaute family protein [Prunus dulcis]|uniref:Argonaute family protein n=1 Tax=Prunus dulcis TaxID=3755 RepID=A0A4Y1QY22_PRUDU|nr:Argonaute family protein [Prunus dulcis]
MDVSTTMIVKPGSVLDFLLENQNVKNNDQIDWIKAKRMLKNLRITAHPSNMEYRITGLSEKSCKEQRFFLKTKKGQDGDGEEITVFDYFAVYKNLPERKSADFPCINVGKPKRPSYFPVEFCDLVSLQRYTKALSSTQRAVLVEQSRKNPQEQMTALRNALKTSKYDADLMLHSSGISISAEFVQVEGRVLPAPKLQVGNGQEFFPRNGRWNFNNKTLVEPVKIGRWAIVNFSARCDIRYLVNSMLKCAEMKGITMEDPFFIFEENYQNRRYPAHVRVEKMFDDIPSKPKPQLLLCILPERKNSDIYGPWKRKNLSERGIVTQCIAPTKLNDQYITNSSLLSALVQLGGMNSLLTVERSPSMHSVSKWPTLILGMDVSHGSPGRSEVPSIAANWPSISHYRAAVRTQSPRVEMIASLFKPVSDKDDEGIIRELLKDFYASSKGRKPDQIIIFRDGVSESQFNQVLNVELDQIIQACKFLDESWSPKFMVIVAQKNHHTKFSRLNLLKMCHLGRLSTTKFAIPRTMISICVLMLDDCEYSKPKPGTTRPAHYHVLYDELGFSADNVQELVHSLSYVKENLCKYIYLVAPICYAHLAAAQISQFIKFDDMSETSSSHAGGVAVPELPRLDPKSSNPEADGLPPPPPIIPPNVVPIVAEEKSLDLIKKPSTPKRVPMTRPGIGSKGQRIPLLTNHFKVAVNKSDGYFFHYSIAMLYEDGTPVDGKGIGRKVLDKVKETYGSELEHKEFAYDGEKSLFTVGPLPRNRLDFLVVLDDISSTRYYTGVNFATKIPMQAIVNALRGQDSEHFQEAVRVLDIILRQNAAKQGCLLVRQSFFHNNPRNFAELGAGVLGCRGFHSSFRATQGGLSLNMDVSTTMIVKPGPVLNFLMENQNVKTPYQIDWIKAKRMLKNLRITTYSSKMEYKITGLSDKPCKEQRFFLKTKKGQDGDGEEITVSNYFAEYKHLPVRDSADFPCINVGKPKSPSYFPLELCNLVSLQRYTKALSSLQRASLVEKSRQKPQERMSVLRDALKTSKYDADLMLRSSGISIGADFVQVEGRVLSAPKLKVGDGQDFFPRNGRWNFNNKKLIQPVKIERWAICNFSARCDTRYLVINDPFFVFEENNQNRRDPAPVRVDKMIEYIKSKLPGPPQLCCVFFQRGRILTYMCIAPAKLNDQYITNVLLKINAKLGGMNSLLQVEHSPSIPLVSKCPTLILGMDVSHGSPGRSDVPSIAAVVSSRNWPLISRYRAAVRTQSPKVEMIASLFKPVSDKEDAGIIRELLLDFYATSNSRKPDQIIIFRDGVSESQFNQVLNLELDQIIQACKFLDESWSPKFMVIVAQKNHHTKFFQTSSTENVPAGTIIDNKVCHPKNNDFYLCSHAGMIGTTRPTHYHVLYDELGFSADDLQELVPKEHYSHLCGVYLCRFLFAAVAPICYAHLAAAQISQFIKFDDMSETSSSHGGGVTVAGGVAVPELPRLHANVINSMFFC